MHLSPLKPLAAAALLAGASSAWALTPWADGAPPVANTIYLPGGSAQDAAFGRVIRDILAVPGSLDVFGDTTTTTSTNFGGRWTAYYFRGSAATGSLAGQPIAIIKRALGAVGYGIIPTIASPPIAIEQLDISTLAKPSASNATVFAEPTTSPGTIPNAGNYRVVVTSANAAALLPLKKPTAGFLTIDPQIMLKPGTKNYPVTVARVGSGTDSFPANLSKVPGNFAQISTGGIVYGVGVNTDFYKVLQAAQKRAKQLPAATVIGDYQREAWIPTLPSNFIGSLIAGRIKHWDDVKIVDKKAGPTLNKALPLTHPSLLADAGVALPKTNAKGKVPVAQINRPGGTALTSLAYARFLGYPLVKGGFAPPAGPTLDLFENTAAPIIKEPSNLANTALLLDDFNQGTNNSTYNASLSKRWGVGFLDGTRNPSGTVGVNPEEVGKQRWRFVRIDGYLPKIANVASGGYRYWSEGVLLYDKNTIDPGLKTVLDALAKGFASPSVAATANAAIVHTWGQTGIFALTKNTAYKASIPYKDSNPVVGYTYNNGVADADVPPVVFDSTRENGVLLQGLPQ